MATATRLAVTLLRGVIVATTLAAARPHDDVIARAGAITITTAALRARLAALQPDARGRLEHDPAALAEFLRNDLLQEMVLAKAHQAGWDRRADVAAAAERARNAEIVRLYIASRLPAQAAPDEAELHRLYDANTPRFMQPREFHLAQIFLALPRNADPATTEKSRLALLALRADAEAKPGDFATAARHSSDDKRSAATGGDLGWIAENRLVSPIKDAVLGLQIGGLTDPLRTADGWHLIELIATRPAGPAPFEQARPVLAQALAERTTQIDTRTYLDTILQHQPIELNQAALNAFADKRPRQ